MMIDNFNNEQWRDIDGYDGIYQVSDLGRVRSLKFGKVRVLRASKNDNGYLCVNLCQDGKQKSVYVHRLVASAFIKNDDSSKTLINHINECKSDNRVSNIEWCTAQYNNTYNEINFRRKNYKRHKIKELYDKTLTYRQNLEIFRANGIECSRDTVLRIRKDLGLTKKFTKRS